MQRAKALRSLSREHNHALVLARRARRAAAEGSALSVRRCWESLRRAWHEEMAAHFDTEERLMMPVLRAAGAGGLAERLLREHRAIRRALADPTRWDGRRLDALGDVLRDHVRREEREAFPIIEQHAAADVLATLAAHGGGHRAEHAVAGRARASRGVERVD